MSARRSQIGFASQEADRIAEELGKIVKHGSVKEWDARKIDALLGAWRAIRSGAYLACAVRVALAAEFGP